MPKEPGTSTRSVVLVDYWDDRTGLHRPYRGTIHDPRSDERLSLDEVFAGLVEEAGAVDGEMVIVEVRRLKGLVPFGERRVRLVEAHTYRREIEEEVGPVVLALRKAGRRADRPVDRPYVLDDSIVEPSQIPPDWKDRIVQIWEEDEVLRRDPDAEHLPQALARLGGPGFDLGTALAKHDDGDSGYDLYPAGWVRGWSYCGDSLHRLVKEK